jgi:hypothetical protein
MRRFVLANGSNSLTLSSDFVGRNNFPARSDPFGFLTLKGGTGADVIDGSQVNSDTRLVIDGGAGNDTLSGSINSGGAITGGLGADTMTGNGVDQFRWNAPNEGGDTITDFNDRLWFERDTFHVAGASFNSRVETSTPTAVAGVDLLVWTGAAVDDAAGVRAILTSSGAGNAGDGMFFAGADSAGHTAIYYISDIAYPGTTAIYDIVDLGTSFAATSLALSTFQFG